MWRYLQLKLTEAFARYIPRPIAYAVARCLADFYVRYDRVGREAVMANLRRIHQHGGVSLSDRTLRVLARENFLNFAKYVVDFFHFLHLKPAEMEHLIEFGNAPAVFDSLLAHGKGVIVVSAHLGNWELGAAAMAQRGYRFNAVALWQPNPRLNRLYQHYRNARNIHPIPFGRAARGCIEALRRNEIVGLVGDRDYSGALDAIEFFGQPARLPDGPAKLALATGAPLLPVFMVRRPNDTYAYVVEEPIWGDRSCDTVADLMTKTTRALERVISQYSEQWYLFHDLWNLEEDRRLATIAAFGEPPRDHSSEQPQRRAR